MPKEERLQKIKAQIQELSDWKTSNARQQIPFNPPVVTTAIIDQDNFVVQTENIIFGDVSAIALEVILDGKTFYMPVIVQN